jgi:hypothetical protein
MARKVPPAPRAMTGSKGPTWKPPKATTTGNYGAAVSAAAHARNAARMPNMAREMPEPMPRPRTPKLPWHGG